MKLSALTLLFLALCPQVGMGQAPPVPLAVSFSRVAEAQNSEDEGLQVELEWRLFRYDASADRFEDFTTAEEVPSFRLRVDDEETVVHDTRYVVRGLEPGKEYTSQLRLVRSSRFVDVTPLLNERENKRFDLATFKFKRVPRETKSVWIGFLANHFKNFLDKGREISYALSVVFLVGLVCSFMYGYRLFRPSTWASSIRKKTQVFKPDSEEMPQKVKGPAASLLAAAVQKCNQYQIAAITSEIQERDSHKMGRVERALYEAREEEINRMAGRSGKAWRTFFFSLEHFWNFGVIAPFLGLLGTVVGISKSFGEVSLTAGPDSLKDIMDRLSGGINEALYTTIGGLIVGVVFLGVYYLFIWRLDAISKAMNEAIDGLLNRIHDLQEA